MIRPCYIAAVAVWLLASHADPALACSCFRSGPPCQATWAADAVFTGTVVSLEQTERETLGERSQATIVTFRVDRGFIGPQTGSLTALVMTFSTCAYAFTSGGQYLVYASKTEGGLTTGICSRTRPIAEAQEDLRYLTTIGSSGPGGRVYGRINEIRRDPAEARFVDYGPVEGLTISLRGLAAARDVVTGPDGRFEITGLPPGKATVSIALPPGFEPSEVEQPIDVTDSRACSEISFAITPVAGASGWVVDESGRPTAGIAVDAVAAELAGFDPPRHQSPVTTDEQGRFEFTGLPPGAYVFGVNLTLDPAHRQHAPPMFLPGTAVAGEAAVIVLQPGDRKDAGVLSLGAARK